MKSSLPTARELPERIARIVMQGCAPGAESHRVVMAVMNAAVACGWSLQESGALFGEDTVLGRQMAAGGFTPRPWQLLAAYHKACLWEAEHVEAIASFIQTADEIGYGRSRTARPCLLALLWLWHRAKRPSDSRGRPTVKCSMRLLSEMVGAPLSTIVRATNRLKARALLSAAHDHEAARVAARHSDRLDALTTQWTLAPCAKVAPRVHTSANNIPIPSTSSPYVVSAVVHARETHHASSGVTLHPVWCEKGLGWNAQRVYAALCQLEHATVKRLADLTGLHRNTISRKGAGVLQRLQVYGLSDRKPDGAWVALEADLDAIAEQLGVADYADNLRAVYQANRRGYRDWWTHRQAIAAQRGPRPRMFESHDEGCRGSPNERSAYGAPTRSAQARARAAPRLLTDSETAARLALLAQGCSAAHMPAAI